MGLCRQLDGGSQRLAIGQAPCAGRAAKRKLAESCAGPTLLARAAGVTNKSTAVAAATIVGAAQYWSQYPAKRRRLSRSTSRCVPAGTASATAGSSADDDGASGSGSAHNRRPPVGGASAGGPKLPELPSGLRHGAAADSSGGPARQPAWQALHVPSHSKPPSSPPTPAGGDPTAHRLGRLGSSPEGAASPSKQPCNEVPLQQRRMLQQGSGGSVDSARGSQDGSLQRRGQVQLPELQCRSLGEGARPGARPPRSLGIWASSCKCDPFQSLELAADVEAQHPLASGPCSSDGEAQRMKCASASIVLALWPCLHPCSPSKIQGQLQQAMAAFLAAARASAQTNESVELAQRAQCSVSKAADRAILAGQQAALTAAQLDSVELRLAMAPSPCDIDCLQDLERVCTCKSNTSLKWQSASQQAASLMSAVAAEVLDSVPTVEEMQCNSSVVQELLGSLNASGAQAEEAVRVLQAALGRGEVTWLLQIDRATSRLEAVARDILPMEAHFRAPPSKA
eukprot:SM000044S15984  [mRNA]  locus=s44:472897:474653:+ [translate_table: standard]